MDTIVIAEIGVNHNGSLDVAKKMVDVAIDCGADIVKFQTGIPEKIISKYAPKAEYQKETTDSFESQLDMVRKISLTFDDFVDLKAYCDKKGVSFLSTPFDLESIDFLDSLGVSKWKIPSGEVTNYPYLVKIAKTGKPVIMSTGMCEMSEIGDALNVLRNNGTSEIILLHCTTEYPAPLLDVNLLAMDTLKEKFGYEVGYSDHTAGIEVAAAAAARGAVIIEKHFTLDKTMQGPDHKASLEPREFAEMVKTIRKVNKALGSYEKKVTESEKKNVIVARKSIVADRAISKGEILDQTNLTTKRPGDGINPMRWNDIIGTRAIRDFEEGEQIEI